MDITDEDLVRRHLDLRVFLKKSADDYAAAMKPWEDQATLIEGEMLKRLNDRGADNSKTASGTFFKTTGTSTRVVDKVAFLDHVFAKRMNGQPNCYDMLTQAVAKDSVIAHMQENDGQPPPGIEATQYVKVQVRKG